jgi:sulfide:quinone oxidoreductase
MFSVPYYSNKLDSLRIEKGVHVLFQHKLLSLNIEKKVARLEECAVEGETSKGRIFEQPYNMIHVTPPMSALQFLQKSALVTTDGWVDVNKHTLQSTRYAKVFSLGDCTNTPSSKTAAAVTAQAPVVVHNIQRMMQGKSLNGFYDGYGACPLIISRGKVLLAEFSYDKKLAETFHRDTGPFPLRYIGTEGDLHQRFFFLLKKYIFPFVYWHLWTHGLWFGPSGLKIRDKSDRAT